MSETLITMPDNLDNNVQNINTQIREFVTGPVTLTSLRFINSSAIINSGGRPPRSFMPGFGLGFGWLLGRQPEAPPPAAVALPASDGDAPAPERPSSPAPGESRTAPPMSAERPARRRPPELKVRRTEGGALRIGLPQPQPRFPPTRATDRVRVRVRVIAVRA